MSRTPAPGTLAPGFNAATIDPTGLQTTFGDSTRRGDGGFRAGDQVGPRYTIIRLLGVGGMGAVYQAFDHELGVAVAIKVILPGAQSDETVARELESRFKRELVLARQVTHKYVVRIHDLGEIDGIKYITMSYLDGKELGRLLKEGPLAIPDILRIMRSVASGLEAAHKAGVIHRDLAARARHHDCPADRARPGGGAREGRGAP